MLSNDFALYYYVFDVTNIIMATVRLCYKFIF